MPEDVKNPENTSGANNTPEEAVKAETDASIKSSSINNGAANEIIENMIRRTRTAPVNEDATVKEEASLNSEASEIEEPTNDAVAEENSREEAETPEAQENKNLSNLDLQRGKSEISSVQDNSGFYTTQYVALKNSNTNLEAQALTVAKYTANNHDEKQPLITIKKGKEVVASFYNVRGEGEQIFMDISDPTLKERFSESKLSSNEVAITGLELDKKLDVRVKGVGDDLGVLFSAFGFQMQTPENNQVLKNENSPYDIEVGEEFLNEALKNQFTNNKDSGCLLGENMSLSAPTLQGMLRASTFNENMDFTKAEKAFADGKVKITSINYDTTIQDKTVKRPIQFIEADGKVSAYLSIVDGKTKREKNGRFYEISKVRVTKDNRVILDITDDSLISVDGNPPHTRTIELPHNNDNALVGYIKNNILAKDEYASIVDRSEEPLETDATLSDRELGYGEKESRIGEKGQIYDSGGFVRKDVPEDFRNAKEAEASQEDKNIEFIRQEETKLADVASPPPTKNNEENFQEAEGESISYSNTPENENSYTYGTSNPTQEAQGERVNYNFSNLTANPEQEVVNETPNDGEIPPTPEPQDEADNDTDDSDAPNDDAERDREPEVEEPETEVEEPTPTPEMEGRDGEESPEPRPPFEGNEVEEPLPPQPQPQPKKKGGGDLAFHKNQDIDENKSNELAAKIGSAWLGIAAILLAFSIFMPFLAIFSTACFATSAIVYTKHWEFVQLAKSKAIDRANAKAAKQRLKEMEKERKAEKKLAKDRAKRAERMERGEARRADIAERRSKNQRNIERLSEENAGIDARIAMLERYKGELQTQNGLLLTHGRQEGDFVNFNLNEADMTEEEKEQYIALLEGINLEEMQRREDFKIPPAERAERHREALYETVEGLQKNNQEQEETKAKITELTEQLSNEGNNIIELGRSPLVRDYVSLTKDMENIEREILSLRMQKDLAESEEEKEIIQAQITSKSSESDKKTKELNELRKSEQVVKYLERADKVSHLNNSYNLEQTKLGTLQVENEDLAIKEQSLRAAVINDSIIEAHKEDREFMSDKKRMATVGINTSLISSLDGEIEELRRIKAQNEKLSQEIDKKVEREYDARVNRQQAKLDRAADNQTALMQGIDDYLINVSDATREEQAYMQAQQEEAKRTADLILKGYNKIKESGLQGEELKKALDEVFLNISNLQRTSPPEQQAGWEALKEQGEKEFGVKAKDVEKEGIGKVASPIKA